MTAAHPVFYVSDGTGITAETIGHSILTQFTGTRFATDRIPFVDTVDKARPLESDDVAVREVEVAARPDLHQRYGIEAVPTVVIADAEGAVRGSIIGPPTAAELWARVAEARGNDPTSR